MSLRESAPVTPGTGGGAPVPRPHRATAWPEARAVAARAGAHARDARKASAVPLGSALGGVLAEPLTALTDLPPFDTSAMDGWAVAGPGPWTVRAETAVLAGHAAGTGSVPEPADGEAVRIATGARVPAGTTAVVRTEHARTEEPHAASSRAQAPRSDDRAGSPVLRALREVVPGQDIRPRGQECRSGDELLRAGTLVTPAVLGLAAAAGYDGLVVLPRPRVEILVLGDELLTAGLPREGLIRDALGPMLGPWLTSLGADVLGTRRIGDDAEELYAAVTGSTADLVVTTGGTAAGPVDHVHGVLGRAGATLLVDGVKVRPGHPMLLARLGAGPDGPTSVRHLVGLPGNPLAAVSGLLTLAAPLLEALAETPPGPEQLPGREATPGREAVPGPEATPTPEPEKAPGSGLQQRPGTRTPARVPVQDEVQGHPYDTRLVPVVRRGGRAVPLRYNGPAMLRGIAAADGLAVVPPGGAAVGQELDVLDLPRPLDERAATAAQGACFT
ncbi:molybdopterin molybdotransferase MoeA [Streptomyces sp. NPDC101490]|uniref:molybdopterin molybdotransferase MoeA n=1 Tax=Streptomyces sp. NPDC101490 TaxID=3366143 RepID=UPI003823487D